MSTVWEEIKSFIEMIEPLLLVVIPTCFGLYLKIKNKVNIKKQEIEKRNEAKNHEKLLNWEHDMSMHVVDSIHDICNYYKDVGHMDLVNYIQLENGTVATSKLYNMFVTCLAEDNRHSIIRKMINDVQRIPYNKVSVWVNNARANEFYFVKSKAVIEQTFTSYEDFIPSYKEIKSLIVSPVKNPEGVLIGFCAFYYTHEDWNNVEEQDCKTLMTKFVASVESVFLNYYNDRDKKKEELNII